MNNFIQQFIDCNDQPLSNVKVLLTPQRIPEITGSYLSVGDSYQFTTSLDGTITSSIVASTYKVDINGNPATTFYLIATETGSYVYSASVQPGGVQCVYFDLINLVKFPFSVKKVQLTPKIVYPVYFSGSIECLNTTSSFTDGSGSVQFDTLIPGVYQVDAFGKIDSTWFMSVPQWPNTGSGGPCWNAKDLIIVKPSKGIPVKLNNADNSYVLTVSSSDARYLPISSYTPVFFTSSWAVSSSVSLQSDSASHAIFADSASYVVGAGNATSASWASESFSSSHALMADSASFASEAYHAVFADTSSYAIVTQSVQVTSASWADFAGSSSYGIGSLSASYALRASNADSASWAPMPTVSDSSSWASSSLSASFADTASFAFSSSATIFTFIAEFAITSAYVHGSDVDGPVRAATSASWASSSLSSSFALQATTASFARSASNSIFARTSSVENVATQAFSTGALDIVMVTGPGNGQQLYVDPSGTVMTFDVATDTLNVPNANTTASRAITASYASRATTAPLYVLKSGDSMSGNLIMGSGAAIDLVTGAYIIFDSGPKIQLVNNDLLSISASTGEVFIGGNWVTASLLGTASIAGKVVDTLIFDSSTLNLSASSNVMTFNLIGNPATGGKTSTLTSNPAGLVLSTFVGGTIMISNDIQAGGHKFLGTASYADSGSFSVSATTASHLIGDAELPMNISNGNSSASFTDSELDIYGTGILTQIDLGNGFSKHLTIGSFTTNFGFVHTDQKQLQLANSSSQMVFRLTESRASLNVANPVNTFDVAGNISCSVITASLLGTSSYATNADHAITASNLDTGTGLKTLGANITGANDIQGFSIHMQNDITSSNGISASFFRGNGAGILGVISSSYSVRSDVSVSASFASASNYAVSSSFANHAISADTATSATTATSSSWANSGSSALSASSAKWSRTTPNWRYDIDPHSYYELGASALQGTTLTYVYNDVGSAQLMFSFDTASMYIGQPGAPLQMNSPFSSSIGINDATITSNVVYANAQGTYVAIPPTTTIAATSSWAVSASWAPPVTSVSASFASRAITSSYAYSSSWADNATSAAVAISSSYGASSSFAITSSWGERSGWSISGSHSATSSWAITAINSQAATSASYTTNALTASYSLRTSTADNATSASYSDRTITASYAYSSSQASSSSYAVSASWAPPVTSDSASFASRAITSSYAYSASWAGQVVTASFATRASVSVSSSWASSSMTTSYVNDFEFNKSSSQNNVTQGVVIVQHSTASYAAAFFDYYALNISTGTDQRAGTVVATWLSGSVEYDEVATTDIGDTTDLDLAVNISESFVRLVSGATSYSWSVKAVGRYV